MGKPKAPAWTREEVAIMREEYPSGGLNGVADLLPDRTWKAIHQMAFKLGLKTTAACDAPKPKIAGAELEEAIRLREEEGWSFARIGASFGVCEASASNSVLIALCRRKGYRPAERDQHGRLTAEGRERIRYAFRKGLKHVDIQLRLGVSAACLTKQRRDYNEELKANGKALLPPPGGGARYSGARVSKDAAKAVERLYLEGYGTAKVSAKTGVSKTHCLRTRARLIKRLRRRGQALPGCDLAGTRRVHKDTEKAIPEAAKAELRRRILAGGTVRGAALELGIGLSSAYKIRDALAAELPNVWKRRKSPAANSGPKPRAIAGKLIFRYRQLVREMSPTKARAALFAEVDAAADADAAAELEARRRQREEDRLARAGRSFEEKLADVAAGRATITIEPAFNRRSTPDFTLGGIATGQL